MRFTTPKVFEKRPPGEAQSDITHFHDGFSTGAAPFGQLRGKVLFDGIGWAAGLFIIDNRYIYALIPKSVHNAHEHLSIGDIKPRHGRKESVPLRIFQKCAGKKHPAHLAVRKAQEVLRQEPGQFQSLDNLGKPDTIRLSFGTAIHTDLIRIDFKNRVKRKKIANTITLVTIIARLHPFAVANIRLFALQVKNESRLFVFDVKTRFHA